MPKVTKESVIEDLLDDHSDGSGSNGTNRTSRSDPCKQHKNKKCNCKEPKLVQRDCCNGNECCGNAACVVAACDPCDVVCLNNALNLVVTAKRFIPLVPPGTTVLPTTPITTAAQNFYVQLPDSKCKSGPVSLIWSVANLILNNFQAANISSLVGTGVASVTIPNFLHIITDAAVFDVARTPAAQNNGFGTFGLCGCRDGSVTYRIDIVFLDPSLSGVAPFISGDFIIYNSSGNRILTYGRSDLFSSPPSPFTFNIITGGNAVTIFFGDPVPGNEVTPVVKLDFWQSSGDNSRSTFYALHDSSTLYG